MCPTVMANRRERSTIRAVPCVGQSVAAIIKNSNTPGFMEAMCAKLGCNSDELEQTLEEGLFEALYGS